MSVGYVLQRLGFNVFVETVYFLDFCVMFRTLFLGVNTLYICKCVFCIIMGGEKRKGFTHTTKKRNHKQGIKLIESNDKKDVKPEK